jgi:hypothetical protein
VEEERKGKKGRLTGGARASVTAKEKEKREGGVGRRGMVRWAAWAEKEPGCFLFFFLFLFQTSFSNQISS